MIKKRDFKVHRLVIENGKDIIKSKGMQLEKEFIQHGEITCYDHSVRVACMSVKIANFFHVKADMRSLIRGALLHDYFLYDWHKSNPTDRMHGFSHAGWALKNAVKDFHLNEKEKDIIKKHMFPLNIAVPKYKESVIVNLADKTSALWETLFRRGGVRG